MRVRTLCAAMSAAVVLIGSVTQAAVFTDSDLQILPNDTNVTLNLSKFNTSLGTLTNVWVEVGLRIKDVSVEMDNDALQAQNGTARVLNSASSLVSSVTLLKTDFDSIDNGDMSINASHVFPLSGTSGDTVGMFNQTFASDFAAWQPGTLSSNDSGNIFSGVWSGYQGTGDFTVTVKSTYVTSATFVGNDGYFQGNTPHGEFYGQVVYSYIPIPEPTALAIMGLGGLLLIRRRA